MKGFALTALLLLASVGRADNEVNLYVSRNIAPAQKIRLSINTKNLPSINLEVRKLDPIAWLARPSLQDKRPSAGGPALRSMPITVIQPRQRPNLPPSDTYYSRQINLPPMSPGVYLISTPSSKKGQNWAVVVVTNLAVVAKRSPSRLLAWVTDFRTGAGIPGVEAGLYGPSGTRVIGSKTGVDGVCVMERKAGDETLVLRHGDDYAGVPAAVEDPDGRLVTHFQTDRPIYRPGQTVSFKAALRFTNGQGYSLKPGQKIRIWVRDSKDTPIDKIDLVASANGTVAGQTEIPSEGSTGPYSIVLEAGKQTSYQTFTVAAYRKPEYKVDVAPTERRALAGEAIRFKIDANYYFGAPVPQAEVAYTIRRSSLGFSGYQDEGGYYSGDGNLYPSDTYAGDQVVASETVHTDNQGNVVIEAKTDPKAPDSTYRIELTVTDGSRRQVTASTSIPVYAAKIRLGLSSDLLCVPLGKLIPVTVRVVDLDGKPASATVSLNLVDSVWKEKSSRYEDVVLATAKAVVPASGVVSTTLPAKAVGSLRIVATAGDGTGRQTSATFWTYVVGPFEKAQREVEGPKVQIRLDRKSYAMGERVSAYVTTNRPAGERTSKTRPSNSPVLVVVEGRDVFAYRVFASNERNHAYGFVAGAAHAPNVYLDATQWVEGQLVSANTVVPVPDPSRKLSVSISSNKQEYRPGDRATYVVKTTDAKGKPVAAEVALSVIDEAIYALQSDTTADAYQLYWGRRENFVVTTGSAPEAMSGGAYQRASSAVASVRQRFEDTAFWNGMVQTDATGTAKVEFEMPGNLTSWRATARAIDGATRTGTARGTVLATRPVTLRLAMPRLLVHGDVLNVIATVNNRSAEERAFDVSLLGEGTQKQRVRVAAKSEAKVEFSIDAATLGGREVTAQAVDVQTGDAEFSDALRIAVNVVPNAVSERVVAASRIDGTGKVALQLPGDSIAGAGGLTVRVFAGSGARVQDSASRLLAMARYGTPVAIAQLSTATISRDPNRNRAVRESLALLSRVDSGTGWGWWEGARNDPHLTAGVLRVLVDARKAGIEVPDQLFESAKNASRYLYEQTNLWEYRAVLASAMLSSKAEKGAPYVAEVLERGQNLSPYAKLRLAESIGGAKGAALVAEVSKDVSRGPSESYLPVGDGIGWRATELETNALLLRLTDGETSHSLAEWVLGRMDSGWVLEDAECLRALSTHLARFPERTTTGDVSIQLNGESLKVEAGKVEDVKLAHAGASTIKPGANEIAVKATGPVRVIVEANVFRPVASENDRGIRVIRRFEIRNAAGTWVEATGTLPVGQPVRVTTVVWGDSVQDAIRVTEPLPAGFEFVEDEQGRSGGRQEVRDGAVLHYVEAGGTPLVFRYFIRAESTGRVTIVPSFAEVLRRPSNRGHTGPLKVRIERKP